MVFDLSERLNWQQACDILGCSKSLLYRLVKEGKIPMYGVGKRFRWFLRRDLEKALNQGSCQVRQTSLS